MPASGWSGVRILTFLPRFLISLVPALLLFRLASRDQVCRDAGNVNEAFAAALGGDLSVGLLNTRVLLIKEKVNNEHEKLQLGPDKALFLLRQRVVYEMTAAGIEFSAPSARCFVRALQHSGASSLEELVDVAGPSAQALGQ